MEIDTQKMEAEIKEAAIKQLVEKFTKDYHYEKCLPKTIMEEIARRVADKYYPENEVALLANIDLETVTKIATLKLVSALADKISRMD